jgi:hypothetical protein
MHRPNGGYVVSPSGCRLGRGYQPRWALFYFTVIRRPRPECNYLQINVGVTFVTWVKSTGEFRLGDLVDAFELWVRLPARLRDWPYEIGQSSWDASG